ncbi:golgin subfamily A member 6-like protein 22 [Portunus trituberculatus]|uniref:golgin subfamily A member 6-like protein 22 n=1 Tax=Portunus trituberculatus TaxID=210409 RepID=UPI001E1CC78E|nr:golgin subfamily A member 6-like protein 22 [Portunus trituberculatus]
MVANLCGAKETTGVVRGKHISSCGGSTSRGRFAEVSGLEGKLSAAEVDLTKLLVRVEEAERLAEGRNSSLEEKEKAVWEAEASIASLQQEVKDFQTQHQQEVSREVSKAKEQWEAKLTGVRSLEEKIQELTRQLDEAEEKVEQTKGEAKKQCEKLKEELEETKKDLAKKTLEAKRDEEKKTLDAKKDGEKKLDEIKREMEDIMKKAQLAEKRAEEASRREEAARGEKLAAELNAWEMEGKIDPLKDELSHYLEAANTLKTEQVESEREEMHRKVKEVKEEFDNYRQVILMLDRQRGLVSCAAEVQREREEKLERQVYSLEKINRALHHNLLSLQRERRAITVEEEKKENEEERTDNGQMMMEEEEEEVNKYMDKMEKMMVDDYYKGDEDEEEEENHLKIKVKGYNKTLMSLEMCYFIFTNQLKATMQEIEANEKPHSTIGPKPKSTTAAPKLPLLKGAAAQRFSALMKIKERMWKLKGKVESLGKSAHLLHMEFENYMEGLLDQSTSLEKLQHQVEQEVVDMKERLVQVVLHLREMGGRLISHSKMAEKLMVQISEKLKEMEEEEEGMKDKDKATDRLQLP